MKIRILKDVGPGCIHSPGSILKMDNKRAMYLIDKGFAVKVDDEVEEVSKVWEPKVEVPPMPVVKMEPDRFICHCGLVCASKDELVKHWKKC